MKLYLSGKRHRDAETRFWARVKVGAPDVCWEWQGPKVNKGYGAFCVGRRFQRDGSRRNPNIAVHRLSWELHHAQHVPDGLWVLHKCDNPICVNPAHLFLGDALENVHDMDRKGRRVNGQHKGVAHPMAKLREDEVRQIREALAEGKTQTATAKRFGVCLATVNHIHTGRLWAHLA